MNNSKELNFTVCIPTFDRNDDLSRCLGSLSKQVYDNFDIVIVNGGDYQGVKAVADTFSRLRIKIVNQERRGIVEARNLAWMHSSADIVCIIDDDLVVDPTWLVNIRGSFLSDDNIAGVSGPTIIPEDRLGSRDLALFLNKFKGEGNILFRIMGMVYMNIVLEGKLYTVGRILRSGTFTPGSNYKTCLELPGLIDVDYLEACHMCFRREVIEGLRGFDYSYEGTGEWNEPDFCYKVKAMGRRLVFNPKAVTYHLISQSGVFKARTNSFERSKNFILFYMKWIKPDRIDKIVRFSVNLIFMNLYWFYKFIKSGNPDWLRGFLGTLVGLEKAVFICR